MEEYEVHKTDDGKVCTICKGFYPLPEGWVKGLCPFRMDKWLPDPEVFICAECSVALFRKLSSHAENAMYKEYKWIKKPAPSDVDRSDPS